MACIPSQSLIENIGFGEDATHTTINTSSFSVRRHEIKLPLIENFFIVVDREYDDLFFQPITMISRIKIKLVTTLRRIICR
jgi:hypothetical protein